MGRPAVMSQGNGGQPLDRTDGAAYVSANGAAPHFNTPKASG